MNARFYCAHVATYYEREALRVAYGGPSAVPYDILWSISWKWHRWNKDGIRKHSLT